jgi:subtilase family serine protease
MGPTLFRLAVLAALALTSLPLHSRAAPSFETPAITDQVVEPLDLASTNAVPGHIPAWAKTSRDAGPLPAGTQLDHLALLLARPPAVEAVFQQLLLDQHNPSSPRFHQWLTPQQTGELYGVSQHDLDAVRAWLTSQGLQVEGVSASRVFLTFSGDATNVAHAFSTEIHNFQTGIGQNGGMQYSVTRDPQVPAAFAAVIKGFVGLSQGFDQPYVHKTHAPLASVLRNRSGPTVAPDVYINSGANWILPADFAVLYDVNPVYGAGITGLGQRVAIVGASRIAAADITNFENLAGLALTQPNAIVVPGYADPGATGNGQGGSGDEDQSEATLDVDRVTGTAPGAGIDLVLLPQLTDTAVLAAINYATSTLNDAILNLSFGQCEAQSSLSISNSLNTAFSTGAAQGISIFVSSGDSEVAGCANAGSNYTAGSIQSANLLCTPSVTCAGGTQFSDLTNTSNYWSTTNGVDYVSALSYIPEGVWNEPVETTTTHGVTSTSYVILGGSGGPSIFYPKPAWQTGTGVPADNARDTPDISLSASGHNAYVGCTTFDGESCVPGANGSAEIAGFSGTSAAAPGMAAITALLDQKLNARQGLLNPLLYRIAAISSSAIHDATPATSGVTACALSTASTCNSSTPGATGLTGGLAGFALTTGYDEATGLGSPDVNNLLTAAASIVPAAPTTSALTASATTINTAQSITFTDTITSSTAGTPTGNVQFTVAGTDNGAPITLTSAVATRTIAFPTAGAYTVTAIYSGDSIYASSAGSIGITVDTPVLPAPVLSLTGTTGSITTQQTVTYTLAITSSSTETGSVQFYRGGTTAIGSPVSLVNNHATLAPFSLAAGSYSITAVYSGDANFTAGTSTALSLTVTTVPASVTLTPLSSSINASQTVTFTATVINSSSTGTPTGSLQFSVDNVPSGNTIALSGLSASSPALSFSPGTHSVTASYSGDAIFAASTSPAASVAVSAAPAPTFTLASSPAALSLAPGAASGNTSAITFTSVNGFASAVASTCSVAFSGPGAVVDAPTCVLSPTSVTLAANGTASSVLTLSSVTPHAVASKGGLAQNRSHNTTFGVVAFTALLLILPRPRRRFRAITLLLTAALLTASGCGSGGSTVTTSPPVLVGTTAGAYTVTVNTSSGSLTASTTISVTIQ